MDTLWGPRAGPEPSSRLYAAAAPLAGPSRTHYDYRKLSSSSRDVGVFRQIKQPDRREAG